ncbi:hypothetical protein AJ80_06919 [Polytolypa hystricis UAMH7299]|uniref:Uncharacterized protein n=1 Tax=Polytolypa hystricis (strain UAMH7299) TaxID=1447883 RepID=A0A2B7XT51_POLH7|nr:hypothetical protein AJ80_06919 [Polytolypa hystricis UAMH7299]
MTNVAAWSSRRAPLRLRIKYSVTRTLWISPQLKKRPQINSVGSDRRLVSAPRVVRLSGPFLKERPRRFKMMPADTHVDECVQPNSSRSPPSGRDKYGDTNQNEGKCMTKRVVHLKDWELNNEKQTLTIVMELGDLDFETMLRR